MGKITTAVFEPGSTTANVYGLWQYDYGQTLRIQGLNLPSAVEIHFSLQETGGTSVSRVGVTKDGVTDVIIPDSMLENDGADRTYDMFAFIYLTDATSGQTEYKIKLQVKSRPKPEVFGGEENPNIFHEAVQAVQKSADKAAESEKQAEGWAHGREDLPERAQDNAKYYAGQAAADAKKTGADRKEVERLVESVAGIDEQVAKVENLTKQAQTSATNAALSEQAAKTAETNAQTAQAGAETAEGNAELAEQGAKASEQAVERAKQLVTQMGQEVLDNKNHVDQTVQAFTLTAQQALADVNNAGQTQTERVQSAGNTAVESVKTAQDTATQAVETAKAAAVQTVQTEGTTQTGNVSAEGEKQVQAVQTAAQEIVADREQIQKNKTDVTTLKEDINNLCDQVNVTGRNILPNKSEQGYWDPVVGGNAEPKANASFTRCPNDIPLTAGLSIYVTTRSGLNGCKVCICEIGADGKTVAFENITADGRRTVNASAVKMRVYINGTAISIQDVCISYENIPFEEYSVTKQLRVKPSVMPIDETQIDKIMSMRKANNFAWKDYDKGILSVRVDGGYTTLDLIVKICTDRNIPLIFAPIVEWLDNPVSGVFAEIGSTVRDVGKYIKAHGGEIVVYPRRPITTGDYETQVLPWMIGYKGILEDEFGQPVRGICVAQSATPAAAKKKIERYLYGYFDYSDGHGVATQYNSQSTVAASSNFASVNAFKNWLDDTCDKKQWKTFICHQLDGSDTGLGGLTESTFVQAMDYVASKVASGDLKVMTWANVHDEYGTSVLQKAIDTITLTEL